MIVEIRNALLRSFEAISRSATSQTLWAKLGAWAMRAVCVLIG